MSQFVGRSGVVCSPNCTALRQRFGVHPFCRTGHHERRPRNAKATERPAASDGRVGAQLVSDTIGPPSHRWEGGVGDALRTERVSVGLRRAGGTAGVSHSYRVRTANRTTRGPGRLHPVHARCFTRKLHRSRCTLRTGGRRATGCHGRFRSTNGPTGDDPVGSARDRQPNRARTIRRRPATDGDSDTGDRP